MRNRHTAIKAIGFAALVTTFALFAPAETSWAATREKTHVTFKHPVRIPGVILPAGTYAFKFDASNQVVWIFSEDRREVFGPYLTLPRSRTELTAKSVVILDRSPEAGGVPTVRTWFGRGPASYTIGPKSGMTRRRIGHAFIYPKHGRS